MHLPGILILLHYFLSTILGRDLVAVISAGSFTAKAAKIRQWPRDSQWISAVELIFCCFCTSHSHGKRLPNMPCPHISQLHSNKHKKKSSRGRTKKVLMSWWWMQHGLSRYLKPSHDISCDTRSKEHKPWKNHLPPTIPAPHSISGIAHVVSVEKAHKYNHAQCYATRPDYI